MGQYTRTIDENECIGDSLDTINANFNALDMNFNTAFCCERNGTGIINQFMSHGGSATIHNGIPMPYSGELIKAALEVYGVTGTVTVQPAINGAVYSDYQLTTTGTNLTGGQLSAYPVSLKFNAGDTLGWKQISVPSSANAYHVTFVTRFNM